MNPFWQALLPNLTATLVGVAFGVPFGLWANRLLVAEAYAKRRQIDAAELAALVETIVSALAHSGKELRQFQSLGPGNRTGPRLLDSGTWDALKGRLPKEFGSPDLVRRLAFYWLQLHAFNGFHRSIFEEEIRGALAGEALVTSCNFRNSWARDLSAEAGLLYSELVALHGVNTVPA